MEAGHVTPALTLIGRQVALRSDLHHAGRGAQGEEGDHPLERGHPRILQQVTYLFDYIRSNPTFSLL